MSMMPNSHRGSFARSRSQLEFSRLMTAAVVNERFRKMLLRNPGLALASGYGGESFHLANEEKDRVASIRATSLADFANQLAQIQDSLATVIPSYAGD